MDRTEQCVIHDGSPVGRKDPWATRTRRYPEGHALPEYHDAACLESVRQEVSYRNRIDHDLTEGAGLAFQGALGREIHGWHLLAQLLQAVRGNSPLTVDDSSCDHRVVDPGEQAYQRPDLLGMETNLSVTSCKRGPVLGRLDLLGALPSTRRQTVIACSRNCQPCAS
jgi:hypothetical protein